MKWGQKQKLRDQHSRDFNTQGEKKKLYVLHKYEMVIMFLLIKFLTFLLHMLFQSNFRDNL